LHTNWFVVLLRGWITPSSTAEPKTIVASIVLRRRFFCRISDDEHHRR